MSLQRRRLFLGRPQVPGYKSGAESYVYFFFTWALAKRNIGDYSREFMLAENMSMLAITAGLFVRHCAGANTKKGPKKDPIGIQLKF